MENTNEKKYTGNPEEQQWCPDCKKQVMPDTQTFYDMTGDVTGWSITCPDCRYLFDED